MNHIGIIIRQFRRQLGLTQKDLADGICTARYIYLIEKGDRTPSIDVLKKLSARLRVNLFEVSNYLACKNTIQAYEAVNLFERYRSKLDLKGLSEATQRMEKEEDMQREPLKLEIILNKAIIDVLGGNRTEEIIRVFEQNYDRLINGRYFEKTYIRYLALIAFSYLMLNDHQKSESIISKAFELLNAMDEDEFKETIILTRMIHLALTYKMGKYDETINEGLRLLEYQRKRSLFERTECTYYLITLAYLKKNQNKKAYEFTMKIIYIALLEDVSIAVDIFKKNPDFIQFLSSDFDPKDRSVSSFIKKYNIHFHD